MAAAPDFFTTPCIGRVSFSAANTAFDGTGTLQDLTWIGGGTGAPDTAWMLKRIDITGTGDLADSVVNIFSTDASAANPLLFRSYDLGNPSATSTTASAPLYSESFGPDFVFPANCDLKVTSTVAPTSGNVVVTVFAERV